MTITPPPFNPFPNMPNTTDIGNGLRMVETNDKGHCYRVLEPDGKVSVTIWASSPPVYKPAPPTTSSALFHVRDTDSGQEIVNPQGIVVARTTDPAIGKHIMNLLIVFENMKAKKSSPGS